MPGAQLLLFVGAIFASAFLQAISGFGFALLAMPLVTLLLGLEVARPLVAAAALILYIANSWRLRRHINRAEWLRLAAAAALGVPFGFWLLAAAPVETVRPLLGALLLAYAGYALLRFRQPRAIGSRWAYLSGLTAGALAGAYNIPGPPVVVYGDLRAWPPDEYRSTLQALFLLNGLLVVGGHALLGHIDGHVGGLLLAGLPALAAGNLAGQAADRYLNRAQFRLLVIGLMLVTGASLLLG
jgi:uncharacterized membrane protein YfcA